MSDQAQQTFAPALAEVPLPAPNTAALLRRNGTDARYADRPALRFGDRIWTHAELLAEAERFAALFRARLDPERPPHVGLLLDNTPDYVFALCGAGLAGAAVAGLNHTRVGEHLARDIVHTDVQLLITEPRHQAQLDAAIGGLDLPGGVLVSDRFADEDDPPLAGESLAQALEESSALGASTDEALGLAEPEVDALWALLFTSGTSAAPKAVRCTQYRLLTTGNRMAMMLELTPDDVGYAAMPLFHTNSLMSGLAPALVAGASLSLARRFSASRFLPDVRHYGVTWFNYTGKVLTYILATPAHPDDADNPASGGLRERGVTRSDGGGGDALRHEDHRRLRFHRGRHRPRPDGGASSHLDRASAGGDQGRRRGRARRPRGRSSTPMAG